MSAAIVYDVAFEHFFQAGENQYQDCVFFHDTVRRAFMRVPFWRGVSLKNSLSIFGKRHLLMVFLLIPIRG